MNVKGDTKINLKSISITILTFYMLTASLYVAIFNSLSVGILIQCVILGILIINELNFKKKYIVTKKDLLFVLAIIAVLISLQGASFKIKDLASPLTFSSLLLISFFIRGDIKNYFYSFYLIKWGSVFFALSVLFSYFYPDLYSSVFLSKLSQGFSSAILNSMNQGYHTGFSSQVAYTAGYIINGIGLICCIWIVRGKSNSKMNLLLLLLLIISLLLTQKRGHVLFMTVSLLFVYIQYSNIKHEKIIKSFKLMLTTGMTIIFITIFARLTNFGQDMFSRLIDTFKNFVDGEDITSGRLALWNHAWDLFVQNPILGVGWGNFSKTVIGSVTVQTEMETHNIYLQLLSETGIVGAALILLPLIFTYQYTIKTVQHVVIYKQYSSKWTIAVLYSLFNQTFFLLYGITGNPLYDSSFFIMYTISVGLIYSFKRHGKQRTIEIKKVG